MSLQLKVAITSLVAAAVCFPLTFLVWPPEVPSGAGVLAQWLGYGLLAAECLALGGGIAFVAFAFPPIGNPAVSRRLAIASYAGISFLLINWWPHAHVHAIAANLETAEPLIRQIIYAFHDLIMLIGALLAFLFATVLATQTPKQSNLSPDVKPGGPLSRLGVRWKFTVLTLLIAVVSVPAVSILYAVVRIGQAGRVPAGWLLAGLIVNTVITRLAVGVGISFLIFGWPLVRHANQYRQLATLSYISIGWCLLAWLPYQQLDFIVGGAVYPLLAIGYGFHLTLMLAAVALAIFFFRVIHASRSLGDSPSFRARPRKGPEMRRKSVTARTERSGEGLVSAA
jgi:hypothetical protein